MSRIDAYKNKMNTALKSTLRSLNSSGVTGVAYMVVVTVFGVVLPANAQWDTQRIPLRPGWNAVFLRVQPELNQPEEVFADLPIKSVWAWNRRLSTVRFIDDVSRLVPKQPGWLSYFPSNDPRSSVTNLFAIHGCRAYLIELGGTEPIDWEVAGKVVAKSTKWIPDAINVIGMPVDTVSPPTFADFFASSPAHVDQPIYRLDSSGRWKRVTNPTRQALQAGTAYAVACKGASKYTGPISVQVEQANGIHYGSVLTRQALRIHNHSDQQREVTVKPLMSHDPPEGCGLARACGRSTAFLQSSASRKRQS